MSVGWFDGLLTHRMKVEKLCWSQCRRSISKFRWRPVDFIPERNPQSSKLHERAIMSREVILQAGSVHLQACVLGLSKDFFKSKIVIFRFR